MNIFESYLGWLQLGIGLHDMLPERGAVAACLFVWMTALILDACLGEAKRWHPLAGFGHYASFLESKLNRRSGVANALAGRPGMAAGLLAWLLAVLPWTVLLCLCLHLSSLPVLYLVDITVLYFAIGWRSLQEHVTAVAMALDSGNLAAARQATAMIVSRDTSSAEEEALASAALETTLENSNDALFASLFWYAVGGSVMVLVHRLANTLDAMWGYRTSRFNDFGRVAARMDDVLNFIPAQCVSFCFCLLAGGGRIVRTMKEQWWRQGWRWKSINAGSVMASGAGALLLRLGGVACYHGQAVTRPVLGAGCVPEAGDIARSIALVWRVLTLWLFFVLTLVIHRAVSA